MNARPTFDHPVYDHRDRSLHRDYHAQTLVTAQPARTVDSVSLFEGTSEIGIEHRGALYRLKITRQGKLILNK